MKKTLLVLSFAAALISCEKNQGTATDSGFKTAYVNIEKLSKDYQAFKDLESQSRIKEDEMGRELQEDLQQYQQDRAAAEHQAGTKGPQWVQLKIQEFQKREQDLNAKQQNMAKLLQDEFGAKNDSAVNVMKKYITEYGKKNNYDYIYSTSDVSSIMYAKDTYNITDEILRGLNQDYEKINGKPETEEADQAETKKDSTVAAK